MTERPTMVIDSAGLWFRAFHSVPEKIVGPDDHPVNAVRGFCDMLATLIDDHQPAGVVAALDVAWRPQWRVDALPDYKAHRVGDDGQEDAPATLDRQVKDIRELLAHLGVSVAGAPDSEADDVIAWYAHTGRPLLVVTGDRDLLQLANPSTSVVYIGAGMRKREVHTPASVADKFGLPAAENAAMYADYAVLVGDASDGLPGIAGIGPKTAATLLHRFGSIDGITAALNDPQSDLSPRQRAALSEGTDYLDAALRIVRLGERAIDVECTGDLWGRRGPVNQAGVESIVQRTGQTNAIGRLTAALNTVEVASGS